MRAVPIGILVASLLPVSAQGAAPKKLRYSEAWKSFLCNLERTSQDADATQKAFKRKPKRAFPAEFSDGYVPSTYEWVELVKNPLPCSRVYIKTKKDFRCRLDRVIFRDKLKGKVFIADGAALEFKFAHLKDDFGPYEFLDSPGPIGSKTLQHTVGAIQVRGYIDGKRSILGHEWIKGTPPELTYIDTIWPEFKAQPQSELPIVTSKNYNMYVFSIPKKWAGSVGSYVDLMLVPDGCRR